MQKLVPLMTAGGSVILNTSILGSQGRPDKGYVGGRELRRPLIARQQIDVANRAVGVDGFKLHMIEPASAIAA